MLMQKTRIRTYKQMTKREILADSLLLLTALIWGCAFAVVKNALDSFASGRNYCHALPDRGGDYGAFCSADT